MPNILQHSFYRCFIFAPYGCDEWEILPFGKSSKGYERDGQSVIA